MTDFPLFLLPQGHSYGATAYGSIMIHDGKTDPRDQAAIRQWGAAYRARIRRPRFEPVSVFDASMVRAVAEVQRLAGLPVTGRLGAPEWPLPWTLQPPPGTYVRPGGEHAEKQAAQHRTNVKEFWRKFSKWNIYPGSDPSAPPWYPGRPFGQREYGEHVKPVQEFFGIKPNGRFSSVLAQRVRGYQKTRDLPVSGVVDARTASYLQAETDAPHPS